MAKYPNMKRVGSIGSIILGYVGHFGDPGMYCTQDRTRKDEAVLSSYSKPANSVVDLEMAVSIFKS